MSWSFDGSMLIPGQGFDELQNLEAELCWGRHDQRVIQGAILDADTVDSGHTSYTDILRPGLALGVITATNQLTHWNPFATDGSHRLAGFMMGAQNMKLFGTATERLVGGILVGGNIRAETILIPGQTSAGLSGQAYEVLLREQMAGRFLDNDYYGTFCSPKYRDVSANTAITVADHNTHFTNLAATGSINLTMPDPVPGFHIRVSINAAQNIVFVAATAGDFHNPAGNGDTMTAANKETIDVYTIRTAATPTYKYVLAPIAA